MNSFISRFEPFRHLLVWLFFLMLGSMAQAASFYSATVPLDDNSSENREAAFKDALALVLVKVTGQRGIASESAVIELIDAAPRYVQGYRFLQEGSKDAQQVRVDFDARALEQEVARLGLPVWGSERPQVLLWLAVDNRRGQRFIVAAEDLDPDNRAASGTVSRNIRDLADGRGLPIVLPLYDGQDQDRVSFADVWGGFEDAVEQASERYDTNAILIGRARSRGRSWEVRWTLIDATGRQQWVGGFADGINQTADTYAQAFAVLQSEGEVVVIVDEVTSFSDYGELLSHLRKLSVVEHVDLEQAVGATLTFRLRLRGDTDVLQRSIRLGRRLDAVSQDVPSQFVGPTTLRYRYRP